MGTNTLYTEKHHQYIEYTKQTLPIITVKKTQPIITTSVQNIKTITINKNKDGYKCMCIIHNSPFLYAHSFSFLCCSPPNYVLLLSPFLARIAKGFLRAFVE